MTVLFADLAGFTSRAEAMDPEDVRAFLHPWYDLLEREVTGHGGVVERHLGDGVMALFGAPTAHEDDPERAVRAALRILERLPGLDLDLHARIGINTGEVLFAAATGPGREDAVTGDAVNTAARLQAAAPVDGVVLGETTYRATERLFRWQPMEPVAAKGKAEPVPAWRAIEPVARLAGELIEETTPFVGRDHELQTLVRLFERARSTPSLEVVTVVAEPGIGKSRLVRELGRHVDALPELVTWRVGRCLPYGEGIGFWALSEIAKAQAGILDTDDQVTLGAKLDAAITEPDPSLRRWLTQRLAPLVGLETTAEPPQPEEAYTAWRRFLESIAQTGPLVLIVEDLHWADEGFVGFLRHLADNTTGQPVLLVVTARPEVEERHPDWLGRIEALRLGRLGDADIATLLAAAFPDASSELQATILERTAGSPLYAEQLAAMARDRPKDAPLDEAAVPPTLAALLASRIDMLPPDERAALLDASVVGKTFWSGAVAALGNRDRATVEPLLADLARRDLVRPVFPSSMADEAEFTFVHALVRDVAYGALTRSARLQRHRATAAWITERAGAALGGDAEIVVAHLEQALVLATAARTQDQEGIERLLIEALDIAAETATGTDQQRAVSHFERALELMPPGHAGRPEVLLRFAEAANRAARYSEASAALEEAIASFRMRADPSATARALLEQSAVLGNLGDPRSITLPREALTLVENLPPGPELVEALAAVGDWDAKQGRSEDGLVYAVRAVQTATAIGLGPEVAGIRALHSRGMIRGVLGDADGLEDIREAMELAGTTGRDTTYAMMQLHLAFHVWQFEGPVASLELLREAIAFSGARGYTSNVDGATGAMLDALVDAGRFDEALAAADDLAGRVPDEDVWSRLGVAAARAEIAALRGCVEERQDSLPWLEAASRGIAALDWLIMGLASSALARASVGDGAAAAALLEEIASAPDVGGNVNYAAFLPTMVRTALSVGDRALAERIAGGLEPRYPYAVHALVAAKAALAEARRELRAAADAYADAADRWMGFGVVPEQAHALAGLGRCLLALGETDDGVARLREARKLWAGMKATPRIAEIDALLATLG